MLSASVDTWVWARALSNNRMLIGLPSRDRFGNLFFRSVKVDPTLERMLAIPQASVGFAIDLGS